MRGDLRLARLLTDLYRPASIFQATSISPFISALDEEKFSTYIMFYRNTMYILESLRYQSQN